MDKTNSHISISPSENLNEIENNYSLLVDERKNCSKCKGLKNPSRINNGIYDTENQIGPWSYIKGDLNAKVMVIGQDWGNEEYFINNKGISDEENTTNRRLKELLNKAGYPVDSTQIFFTNAILCMKESDGLNGKIKTSWLKNCSYFLKRQIEIIQPEVIIALGAKAYQTVKVSFPGKYIKFSDSVNSKDPIIIVVNNKQIRLFNVYHCGRSGFINRSKEEQGKDWERIKNY